jgi:hypothetical protein
MNGLRHSRGNRMSAETLETVQKWRRRARVEGCRGSSMRGRSRAVVESDVVDVAIWGVWG